MVPNVLRYSRVASAMQLDSGMCIRELYSGGRRERDGCLAQQGRSRVTDAMLGRGLRVAIIAKRFPNRSLGTERPRRDLPSRTNRRLGGVGQGPRRSAIGLVGYPGTD